MHSAFFSHAQKENIKIAKKQDGIVVLKIALCSSIDDEYCLVTQDIYINKKRHTLGNLELIQFCDSFIQTNADTLLGGFTKENLKSIVSNCKPHMDFQYVTSSNYFTNSIIAQTPSWRRNKGGEMFMQQKQNPYDISYLYIVYKINGTFAFMGQEMESLYANFYADHFQPKVKEKINFPIVEVLNVNSFSKITNKERKRLGLRGFKMEYYRLRITGHETFLKEIEKGKLDR